MTTPSTLRVDELESQQGISWKEFEMHVAAAQRNGLTEAEIGEVILHGGVYLGVPAANHAMSIAARVLEGANNA